MDKEDVVTETQILERLKEIVEYDTTDQWSKGFCTSLIQQVARGKKLSIKQLRTANKIIEENTPEMIQKMREWESEYERDYKESATKVALYYRTTRYYGEITRKILSGQTPNRRAFMKMYQNKYAKKVLEEINRPPRFSTSSFVVGNSKAYNRHSVGFEATGNVTSKQINNDFISFLKKGAVIISVDDKVFSACKGAKRYLILPVGSTATYWIEERYLKNKPKRKNK